MSGYLIKDTTKEEREAIVAESLGNISATCDGCSAIRHTLMERRNSGRLIWNLMPGM